MANKHEITFNFTSHQRNANQNYSRVPFFLKKNGSHYGKKQEMLARMQKKGKLYTWLVGYKEVQTLWKLVQRSVKQLTTYLPCDPATPLLRICLTDSKSTQHRDTCTPKLLKHCSSYETNLGICPATKK